MTKVKVSAPPPHCYPRQTGPAGRAIHAPFAGKHEALPERRDRDYASALSKGVGMCIYTYCVWPGTLIINITY